MKLCKKHRVAELRHEGAELLGQHCQTGGSLPASEGACSQFQEDLPLQVPLCSLER